MYVSEATRRSSSLIDQVAHEAKIVKAGEHVAADATAVSGYTNQIEDAKRLELPSVRADNIRGGYDNDVVNVGLSLSLWGKDFAAADASKRPGMAFGSAQTFANHLNGKEDANAKLVLRARADDGYVTADEAWKACKDVPADQRGAAVKQWLSKNDPLFDGRMKSDLGFAKGVEYCAFVHDPKSGKDAGVERAQVDFRLPLESPIIGTVPG